MSEQQTVIQNPQRAPRARMVRGAGAQRIALNISYILTAGPLGLGYLFLFSLGVLLDLLILATRVLATAVLLLTYWLARSLLRLLQWGARFLVIQTIAVLVWIFWTLIRLPVAMVRGIRDMVVALFHPRTTWRRTIYRVRRRWERTTIYWPRFPAVTTGTFRLRTRVGRFFGSSGAGIERLRRKVVPRPWIVAPTFWWHLAVFERWLTGRWLRIELPELLRPQSATGRRAVASGLLPVSSLGYLLAKVPLGAFALLVVVAAFSGCLSFLHFAADVWSGVFRNGFSPIRLLLALGALGAGLAVPSAGIYVLNALALSSGRFARQAFSPSATVRRLLEAEALVAQARKKVELAERSRQDLIVNVSHELRTPTASIRGHIESLLIALDEPESPSASPEVLRRYLGIVHREAERLATLVDELLALARAETDELQLNLAPVDAAEVIGEVHASLASLARRERQVTLVHEIQPNLPPLVADRQRLVQVLLNLVRNAITYTPPGGLVSVMLQREDLDTLTIAVADTGSGIASEELDRIFERFYRTDASRARSSGGFGLGLSIVRDLVEAMGGTIQVESTLGEGSRFEVTLPIANPPI